MIAERLRLRMMLAGFLVFLLGCSAAERNSPRISRNREAAERLNEEGLHYVTSRALDKAERCFRQAIECDPFCGLAHCNLGITLMEQCREPYEAAWCLRHAAQLMPNAISPRVALAQLFEKAGQFGAAEQSLRDALRLNPNEIEIIGQLARVRVRQNKMNDETIEWLKVVAVQESDATWRSWAQRTLSTRENLLDIEDTP